MSTEYTLTGKVILINDTQVFPSGFTKREFVIETAEEKYPQKIKLDAVKDGCDRLDAYRIGDDITVSFNLRGNEYNGKYFTSLQAWKFDKQRGDASPPPQRPASQNGAPPPSRTATADVLDEDEVDDIPF
jgi:hypothetical protein